MSSASAGEMLWVGRRSGPLGGASADPFGPGLEVWPRLSSTGLRRRGSALGTAHLYTKEPYESQTIGGSPADQDRPSLPVNGVRYQATETVNRTAPAPSFETATLWARTRAIVADVVIVSILQAVINAVFGSEYITNVITAPGTSGGFSAFDSTTTVGDFWLWVAAIGYFALFEGLFGQTPGKAIVGIRVTDLRGRRASWRAVLIRNVLRVIDSFPSVYVVGVLIARYSVRRQRLGDHVAGTIVVPIRVAAEAQLSQAERQRGLRIVVAVTGLFIVGCAAFSYYGRPPIVIGNAARLGQLPGGRVGSYSLGAAQWKGSSITYPIQYTLTSGKNCAGQVTLGWHGFFESWQLSSEEGSC